MDLSSDPLILAGTIRELERLLDSLEWKLKLATGFVVLGLLLEYLYEIRSAITEFKQSHMLKPLLIIAGTILITFGVGGELIVQSNLSVVEGKLRLANHGVQAALDKKAGEARQAASEADERAANANSIAQAEQLERIRLQAAIAPRSLSRDQQREIIRACNRYQGHSVVVYSYGLDGEASLLGGQIISVLRAAHINAFDARGTTIVAGGFEVGLHLRGPDVERDFITELDHGLSSIGKLKVFVNDLPPKVGAGFGGGGPTIPPGTIFVSIMIGIKPVPILSAAR